MFPISRDPPEGGTRWVPALPEVQPAGFQFLGIPPKGELVLRVVQYQSFEVFPISRDPPEGGTDWLESLSRACSSQVSNF